MLDNYIYRDNLRLCNSYCLFSTKMVVLTCLKYYFVGMLPILWKEEPVYKNEYSTLAVWYWQGQIVVHGEKPLQCYLATTNPTSTSWLTWECSQGVRCAQPLGQRHGLGEILNRICIRYEVSVPHRELRLHLLHRSWCGVKQCFIAVAVMVLACSRIPHMYN